LREKRLKMVLKKMGMGMEMEKRKRGQRDEISREREKNDKKREDGQEEKNHRLSLLGRYDAT